jgi:death-on-curing family protein
LSAEEPVFLDLEYVLEAHRTYFGRALPFNRGLLESAVHAALQGYCYSSEQLDLFELVAYYACHISGAHAFADGNKRTALLAATGFLESNGIETSHYNQDDLVNWLVDAAAKTIDRKQFARRLRCALGFSEMKGPAI